MVLLHSTSCNKYPNCFSRVFAASTWAFWEPKLEPPGQAGFLSLCRFPIESETRGTGTGDRIGSDRNAAVVIVIFYDNLRNFVCCRWAWLQASGLLAIGLLFGPEWPVSRLGAIEALLLGASYRQEAIIAHWNGFGGDPCSPVLEKPPLLSPSLWLPLIAGCALVVAVCCRCHLQLLIKWISLYY